jgi:hypothetical protein
MNIYLDEYNSSLYSSGRTISHIRDLNDFFNDNSNNSDKISAPIIPLRSPSALSEKNNMCKSHDLLYPEQKPTIVRRMSAATQRNHIPVQSVRPNHSTLDRPSAVGVLPRSSEMKLSSEQQHTMLHNYPPEVNMTVRSNSSIHSTYSDKSDELNSIDHLSSEDNLSHDSYDLVDREEDEDTPSSIPDTKFHAYDNTSMCKKPTYQLDPTTENELKVLNYCSVHSSRVSSPQPQDSSQLFGDNENSLKGSKARGSRRSSRHGMDSTYESKSSLVETVIEVTDTGTAAKDLTLNKAMQLMIPNSIRDSSNMHDVVIIRSPTHLKYFNQHFNREPKFKSRTLPRKMHTQESKKHSQTSKKSGTPHSNSSSSNGSPKLFRPKSLDFLGLGLNNLAEENSYFNTNKYDCEDSSSVISILNDHNCSSSDAPQSPENGLLSDHNRNLSYKGSPNDSKVWSFQEEKIYDIPEGIESAMENVVVHKCSYAPKSGKFSSEDSESFPNPPPANILKKTLWNPMTKVSSTESESIPPPVLQVDSDTLSLPLDLLSPPMESESSTALVESESLPAPPQFDNKDDTDIDEESAKDSTVPDDTLDFEPIIQHRRKESVLLHALDTFDSFNMENDYHLPCLVKRQESTYEDKAESILEKQRTVGSFTVQDSVDDVFVVGSSVPNALDIDSLHYRTALLESQSTFESVTTEREILVTKRQESTFEDKAEAMLESQNTIDSFTTEYQNESFSRDNSLDPIELTTSFSNQGSFDGVVARRGSLIKESPIDLNDGDFGLPDEQLDPPVDHFVTDCCNKPEHFHPPFLLQRTLSRISEKSSNYSDSSRSEAPAHPPANPNTSVSEREDEVEEEEEINYSASDDNENAPSIDSDLLDNVATPTNEVQDNVETIVPFSSPESNNVSLKDTEYTNVDQDTLEDDLDDTNAEEIKTEERLSVSELDPDASISTENNISKRGSEDGSLHDSMELLENVKTVDHFDDPERKRESIDRDDLDSSSKLDPEEPDMFENSGKFVVTEGSEELMF